MNNSLLDLDTWTLRDGECLQLCDEMPACIGEVLAVMARSVSMPPGPHRPSRDLDGEPVEMAAILCARFTRRGEWVWQQLSPPTKEYIGDFMFNHGAEKDRWHYLLVSSVPTEVHIVPGEEELDDAAMETIGNVARQIHGKLRKA